MTSSKMARILCVDDEPKILSAMKRQCRRHFDITVSSCPNEALRIIQSEEEFAVIVSDYLMPGMNGVEFFGKARELSPDSARILLTGEADLQAAVNAVNEGKIFRFLWKPCESKSLLAAINAGVEQYRLIQSERILLEHTLLGSVRALSAVLSLASPAAFGRSNRLCKYVNDLAAFYDGRDRWEVEIPVMMSQLGLIILPAETLDKLYHGHKLSNLEQAMVEKVPHITRQLLAKIPRLEKVQDVLNYQQKNYDGSGEPNDLVEGDQIPWGARALRIASDYDLLISKGLEVSQAIDAMRAREGTYDPQLLQLFARSCGQSRLNFLVQEVDLMALEAGMLLQQDVRSLAGVFLIAKGTEVTEGLIQRLKNIASTGQLQSEFRVQVPVVQAQEQVESHEYEL